MALIQKKISKLKQLRLGLALVLVLGITGAVAYYGIFKKPNYDKPAQKISTSLFDITESKGKTGFEAIQEFKDSSIFRDLKPFGIWPLPQEPKGRSQPFFLKQEETE
jgi:hypothetical protein